MIEKTHWIHLQKDAFKFSAAHMTVFPDGSKEALHGHNYSVRASFQLKSTSFQQMVPFSAIKALIQAQCDRWDEKILLPERCPNLNITPSESTEEIEFRLCGKHYIIPIDEVVLLSLENISLEALSDLYGEHLLKALRHTPGFSQILSLEIEIQETAGQSASTSYKNLPT